MDKNEHIKKINAEYKKLPFKTKGWSLSERFVKGDGPIDANVMIIGQAPGKNEDIQGVPFIGTSGKFLDRLINMAGLERQSVYITSVVQFFPPKNRIPTPHEIEICSKFLFAQIKVIDPDFVILLGSVACKTLLGMDKVASIHGKVVKRDGITYMVSMHPAAGVRIRSRMPVIENDFKNFRKAMK